MSNEDMPPPRSNASLDDQMQTTVVLRLTGLYPETFNEAELVQKITQCREKPRPQEAGAVIEAIADLAGDGVIHREAGRVHLSRAVVRYVELTEDY